MSSLRPDCEFAPPELFELLAQCVDLLEQTVGMPPTVHHEEHVANINADTAASRIASELGAENLILMTDIAGLLKDKDDPSTLIPSVNVSDVPYMKRQGIISGGMIPKIECCVEAVRRGVNKTVIIDGRVPHSILIELLTNEGIGTQFT